MDNQLFREEALAKIESPERLNEMVKITSTRNWLVLASIFGIVAAAVLWSVFGRIPYTINGQGILLQSGGIVEVAAIAFGKIESTSVNEGDMVKKNDILAYIAQPELKLQLEHARKKLADYQNRFLKISQFGAENLAMKKKLLEKEEENLLNTIKENEERLNFMTERINAQKELLEEGLITNETLNNTKHDYFSIKQENDKFTNDLKEIHHSLFEIKEKNEIEMNILKSEILELERNIRELKALYKLNSIVRSPCDGKVIELMVNPGKVVHMGSTLLSIEPSDLSHNIEAIIYINPSEGKKIEPQMKVKLAPSTVEVEEFGYIMGIVKKVSEYPSTHQGMLRTLGNIELVKTFSSEAPPIAIIASLEKDSSTFSGFKWTSRKGPELEIKSGTLCFSKIVIKTQKPIALLFPKLSSEAPGLSFMDKFKLKKKLKIHKTDSIQTKEPDKTTANETQVKKVDTPAKTTKRIAEKEETGVTKAGISKFYKIQIAATKKPLNAVRIKSIYSGPENVREEYIDNWYKYSIGTFNSFNEAYKYQIHNKLSDEFFITSAQPQ